MELTKQSWGSYCGEDIYLYKLANGKTEVMLTNFGATITGINIPDKNGNIANIVLSYDTLAEYVADEFYIGCTIGRYAGRIAKASFNIDGCNYKLAPNEVGKNIHLHGGHQGFSKKAFNITDETLNDGCAAIEMHYRSSHLEEGYPGNLDIWVTYQLSIDNRLTISYRTLTDRDTHINLTNHSYFDLTGKKQGALNNRLFIDADKYVVTDEDYLPTGDIAQVDDTPCDFKTPHMIASRMAQLGQIGYNHCFVLNKGTGNPSASLTDDVTGRKMSVYTDMPALVFYSGSYLNKKFAKDAGICLETQFFPDSPHHTNFPSTLLTAGKLWQGYTDLIFSWD